MQRKLPWKSPLALVVIIAAGLLLGAAADEQALPGYHTPDEINAELRKLSGPGAELLNLGRTLQGREILALRVGSVNADTKPGIAVIGSVNAPERFGAEAVLRMARGMLESAATDKFESLVSEHAWYFIPEPCPDAAAACLTTPYSPRTRNSRPVDDDNDGALDEDGPEDLNGDGWITQMRVADPAGRWMPHPLDGRVLIEADASKGERGSYSVYSEGWDNDGDGRFNEDGPGGVDLNRNFSFGYPAYAADAGLNPVSEAESRALADFLAGHPNIALVYCFSPQDNLGSPWKAGNSRPFSIMDSVLGEDAKTFDLFSKRYGKLLEPKDVPEAAGWGGSFAAWAYFHCGRWVASGQGWWVPKPEEEKKAEQSSESQDGGDGAGVTDSEPEKSADGSLAAWDKDDKRGERELTWLKWLDTQETAGFADWKPVSHEGLPKEGQAEVGGFMDLRVINPPASELDELARRQGPWLEELAAMLPRLELAGVESEALGGGVFRISARLLNTGQLPTMPLLASGTALNSPLQAELKLPEGASVLTGSSRRQMPRLDPGGSAELSWLVSAPAGGVLTLRAWSPSVGEASAQLALEGGQP